jgi:hypothetical protein
LIDYFYLGDRSAGTTHSFRRTCTSAASTGTQDIYARSNRVSDQFSKKSVISTKEWAQEGEEPRSRVPKESGPTGKSPGQEVARKYGGSYLCGGGIGPSFVFCSLNAGIVTDTHSCRRTCASAVSTGTQDVYARSNPVSDRFSKKLVQVSRLGT